MRPRLSSACVKSYLIRTLLLPFSMVLPDDPFLAYQPSVFRDAWQISHDAPDTIVAVIDSGIDAAHPDLAQNLWVNPLEIPENGVDDDGNGYVDDRFGYDFVHDDPEPDDEVGHGTIMAGIIGAIGNNGIGIAGAAWSIQLMNLKVLGPEGDGLLGDFVEAIHYAIDHGAQIISAAWTFDSVPGDGGLPPLREALERAESEGVLVITAAGNDGRDLLTDPVYPANYRLGNLVSVAALAEDDQSLAPFSNHGAVDLAAPGVEVIGTLGPDDYGTLTGTSPASAIVTGAASLVWSVAPSLSPPEVRSLLLAGADPLQETAVRGVAAGRINVLQSLEMAKSGVVIVGASNPEGEEPITLSNAGGCTLFISVR